MIKPKLHEVLAGAKLHRPGICNICGRGTVFFAINPTPRSVRNTMHCFFCGSIARKRHVAKIILEKTAGKGVSLSHHGALAKLSIFNTQSDDAFSRILGKSSRYICSDFIPGVPAGTEIDPRRFCQDLQSLSFSDDLFDIVITEDVLEHVRDAEKAFREIWRVLKPGGYHIFTIPFNFDRKTVVRIDTSTDEDIYLLPPEYHGDPVRGSIISYRTFGLDLFALLNLIGFETDAEFNRYFDRKWGIFDSYVFCSRKCGQ